MVGPDAEHPRGQQGGGRAGQLDRLPQGRHRRGAALAGQGDPELEQEAGPVRGGRRLVQRAAQAGRGRARGAASGGGGGGRAQQRRHPRVTARLAAQQVQREAFGVGPVAFQQPGRFGVGQGPLTRRDRLVDGGPHDGMGELEHRAGRQHVGRAQPVSQPRRGGQVQAGQRGGLTERRGAAEDRQRAGQPPGPGAFGPDPAQHRLRELGLVRAVAYREQQRDRQVLDADGQVGEPAQRRRVGPVRVVHREHQRLPGRQVGDQPVQAVHGGVADVVFDRAGFGPVEHPGGQGGRPVHQPVLAADRVEQLADDAVAEALLQRQPAGGEDTRARSPAGRPEQRGLADPGRPLHQDQGTVPGLGRRDGGGQRRQLRVAFEYDRVFHPTSA